MKKTISNILFIGILLFLAVISVSAATYLYNANEISYDNTKSGLSSTDVQSAMSELYTKCNTSTTTCPSGHTCTDKTNIKCIRATTLHTETCTNQSSSSYCQLNGHALNSTITYGNSATTAGVLSAGDAFDCNVNGTGYNQRFYYVSDYYDTSVKAFNDKVAVLMYYSNTDNGVASTTNSMYANIGNNINNDYYGPVTAVTELPTTTQWSNIRLYKNVRQIITDRSGKSSNSNGTLPTAFSYANYAARLITYQELYHGCRIFNNTAYYRNSDKCEFLYERTQYANPSIATKGSWIETPGDSSGILVVHAANQSLSTWYNCVMSDVGGTRPVIDVLKSEMLY